MARNQVDINEHTVLGLCLSHWRSAVAKTVGLRVPSSTMQTLGGPGEESFEKIPHEQCCSKLPDRASLGTTMPTQVLCCKQGMDDSSSGLLTLADKPWARDSCLCKGSMDPKTAHLGLPGPSRV